MMRLFIEALGVKANKPSKLYAQQNKLLILGGSAFEDLSSRPGG
jgi:hypothetical protein